MFKKNLFNAKLAEANITKAELAQKMGIDPSTLSRKLQKDGDFSREEINKLIEILKIDNPKEIFFAEELA